jgi:hypothetical protein
MPNLWPSVFMAEKMGKMLARRPVLLGQVQARKEKIAGIINGMSSGESSILPVYCLLNII